MPDVRVNTTEITLKIQYHKARPVSFITTWLTSLIREYLMHYYRTEYNTKLYHFHTKNEGLAPTVSMGGEGESPVGVDRIKICKWNLNDDEMECFIIGLSLRGAMRKKGEGGRAMTWAPKLSCKFPHRNNWVSSKSEIISQFLWLGVNLIT